jgi:hypothetical protein
MLLRPAQHRHAGELGAVVGNDHGWTAAGGDQGVELAHDPQARQRGVGDQEEAFAREVVDEGQDAEPAAVGERIRQEIHAPALVGTLRDRHRRPCADCPFAPRSPAHLQPFLTIEATQLLVVHDDAFTLKQDVQPPITEPPADRREFTQPCSHRRISRTAAAIAHRRAVRSER